MVHCTVFQWSVVLYSFLMYVCQYNTVVLLQVGGQLNFLHLFAFRLRTQAAAVDQITFLHTICYYECSHICGLFSFLCLTSVLNISFHATGCNCTATNDLTALLWAVSIEVCSNVNSIHHVQIHADIEFFNNCCFFTTQHCWCTIWMDMWVGACCVTTVRNY